MNLLVTTTGVQCGCQVIISHGGVSMIKINLCKAGGFVIIICHIAHSDFDTENSYAIYFIAWEGKEHHHLLLNAQLRAWGWWICREHLSSRCPPKKYENPAVLTTHLYNCSIGWSYSTAESNITSLFLFKYQSSQLRAPQQGNKAAQQQFMSNYRFIKACEIRSWYVLPTFSCAISDATGLAGWLLNGTQC